MAAEANIEYKNKGFWIPEAFLEVLSHFICEKFEAIGVGTFPQSLQEIYDDCDGNRKGERWGMGGISLDTYILTNGDESDLIDLLEQTKGLISNVGSELSISFLNQLESSKDITVRRNWSNVVKTSSLIGTLNIIQQMLQRTWSSDNYSVNFIGFPHKAGQATI